MNVNEKIFSTKLISARNSQNSDNFPLQLRVPTAVLLWKVSTAMDTFYCCAEFHAENQFCRKLRFGFQLLIPLLIFLKILFSCVNP